MEYGIKDSESVVLICDEERLFRAYPAVKKFGLPAIVIRLSKPAPTDPIRFEDVIAEGKKIRQECFINFPFHVNENSDAACLMYTSGSTGNPKGVVLDHKGILNQMEMARYDYL